MEAASRGVDGKFVRRLGILTTGRQDWGILRSTCTRLRRDDHWDMRLLVGGMHLSNRFGRTADDLAREGFVADVAMPWIDDEGRTPEHEQAAQAVSMLGAALPALGLDALLLVGDRFETLGCALAATLARVPIVHLHGGEETQGAIDNSIRHAVSKLAHLHFVSHADHRSRLIAMGEAPNAIHVVGAPGLDNALRTDLPDRAELELSLRCTLHPPVVLVTLHPTTLGEDPGSEAAAVTTAMDLVPATYVITLPNADPGNAVTRDLLLRSAARPGRCAVEALGERRFWGLLRIADAMLGNSSSALIEAPVYGVPAVNVGTRQRGRLRGENVIDAPAGAEAIASALRRALDPSFRRSLQGKPSPFGDGRAGERIVEVLRSWSPPKPPVKPGVKIG